MYRRGRAAREAPGVGYEMSSNTRFRILVLHGPNLNLLGRREPEVYGTTDLSRVDALLTRLGGDLGAAVRCHQSNHEGQLVDWLHEANDAADGVVINPGGYTHTSVAL